MSLCEHTYSRYIQYSLHISRLQISQILIGYEKGLDPVLRRMYVYRDKNGQIYRVRKLNMVFHYVTYQGFGTLSSAA